MAACDTKGVVVPVRSIDSKDGSPGAQATETAAVVCLAPTGGCANKNMYRSCVLILLALIFVSPFALLKLDAYHRIDVLYSTTMSSTSDSTSSSDEWIRGTRRVVSMDELPDGDQLLGESFTRKSTDNRQCLSPEKGDGKIPKLELIQRWSHSQGYERESVTLLTQLSIDRLSMLENQCQTWEDPLVAVIYVPLQKEDAKQVYDSESTVADIQRGVSSFYSFMKEIAPCKLTIELVGQRIVNERTHPYPINALRNRAMDLAQTELVFVLDVDFVASPRLGLPGRAYKDKEVYEQMIQIVSNKKALVVPAFELTNRHTEPSLGQNYAKTLVLSGKKAIINSYKEGAVDYFNAHDAPWGHGPTNTSRWIRLSEPVMYKVRYEPKYEPFVLLAKKIAPWADERFVGYGGNKIAYINQLKGLGFGFHVHPYAFSIHVPHHRTKAADIFVAHKKSGQSMIENLRADVEQLIEAGTYVPVVLMQGGLGRSCKAADVDKKMSDNTVDNAYYSYRVCHEILKEHPTYDPMDVLVKNGQRECERACRKDTTLNKKKRCSGWYFLQSGGSGGACFQCYLYKKNTYEVLSDKEIQGPVCPRSYCRVGICKN